MVRSDGRLEGHLASYVLPIRTASVGSSMEDLTSYLEWLSERIDLIVVDGSEPAVFAANHALWASLGRHVPPDPIDRCLNGKAWGVRTGVRIAEREIVVVADDDVRYDDRTLGEAVEAMREADLVRPQNVFSPMPWHAAWDTARTLLNRAFGADHPGTMIVRRSVFCAIGGYRGDVLFENLELVRTVRAMSWRVVDRPDLFVPRLPPSTKTFWEQRPRQAYDDLAEPTRFVATLAVLPALAWSLRRGRPVVPALATAAALGMAALGRHRHGGDAVFPFRTILFAPLWVVERACCEWLALGWWLAGGIPYAGRRIRRAAHTRSELRRWNTSVPARSVAAVAHRSDTGAATPTERDHAPTRTNTAPLPIA